MTCREVGACACLSVLGPAASFKPGQGLRQPGLLPGLDQLLPLTVTLEHFLPPGSGAPGRGGARAAGTEEAKAAQDASRATAAPAVHVSDSVLTEADFPALGPGTQRQRGSAAKLGGKRKSSGGVASAGQPADQGGPARAKPQQQPGPPGQRGVGHWPGLSRDVLGWQVSLTQQRRGVQLFLELLALAWPLQGHKSEPFHRDACEGGIQSPSCIRLKRYRALPQCARLTVAEDSSLFACWLWPCKVRGMSCN